jgi:hypothetical protein
MASEQPERIWIALDDDYKRQLFATKTLKTGETEYVIATRYNELREAAKKVLANRTCGPPDCCSLARRNTDALDALRAALGKVEE